VYPKKGKGHDVSIMAVQIILKTSALYRQCKYRQCKGITTFCKG